ncbi:MAG: adenylate/guanylate cyclase domain-containing protein [Deltaproteobacteria bacterium]|nr:MAG: adenylate/guanylate cyclase domain-containing protein [Deltaproteobacteria bacterium]
MSNASERESAGLRLIQFLDRPLLGLAMVSIVLYLSEISGAFGHQEATWSIIHTAMLVFDFIFLCDWILKVSVQRWSYLRSPWCLIDAISCLPILTVLPMFSSSLQSFRFFRGLRMFRVLRSLRILRLLRSMPAFQQFQAMQGGTERHRRFERALFVGTLGFSILFISIVSLTRHFVVAQEIQELRFHLNQSLTAQEIQALGGSFSQLTFPNYLKLKGQLNGQTVAVYFNQHVIEQPANLIEFFLVVGVLMGMLLLFYLFVHLLRDVSFEQIRGILHIVLPHQVAEQFLEDPQSYNNKHCMPGSILFVDIKGFTRACEELDNNLNKLSEHLEGVMDDLAQSLLNHNLIIDKFIGDSIMSFAGGPFSSSDPQDNAYRMVRAALAAMQAMDERNDPYFRHVKVGGASAQDCLIGAFGTSTRLSYTVLGDGVNLAARLEAACGECKTRNLFGPMTYELCQDYDDIQWRCWGMIRVKGKLNPIRVYEAFDAQSMEDTQYIDTFHKAWEAFSQKEFKEAKKLFQQADQQAPGGDDPSKEYIQWCEVLIKQGTSKDWEPVLRARKG